MISQWVKQNDILVSGHKKIGKSVETKFAYSNIAIQFYTHIYIYQATMLTNFIQQGLLRSLGYRKQKYIFLSGLHKKCSNWLPITFTLNSDKWLFIKDAIEKIIIIIITKIILLNPIFLIHKTCLINTYFHTIFVILQTTISAPQSKNVVSTNIKHSRYIHLMSNFLPIYFHTKRLYVHMFDIPDTPFGYGRGLIIC